MAGVVTLTVTRIPRFELGKIGVNRKGLSRGELANYGGMIDV